MGVFDVRERMFEDYREFTTAFVDIVDSRIKQHIDDQLDRGEQWPEPWISLNPSFASGGTIEAETYDRLAAEGISEIR